MEENNNIPVGEFDNYATTIFDSVEKWYSGHSSCYWTIVNNIYSYNNDMCKIKQISGKIEYTHIVSTLDECKKEIKEHILDILKDNKNVVVGISYRKVGRNDYHYVDCGTYGEDQFAMYKLENNKLIFIDDYDYDFFKIKKEYNEIVYNEYKCKLCYKILKSKIRLDDHYRIIHKKNDDMSHYYENKMEMYRVSLCLLESWNDLKNYYYVRIDKDYNYNELKNVKQEDEIMIEYKIISIEDNIYEIMYEDIINLSNNYKYVCISQKREKPNRYYSTDKYKKIAYYIIKNINNKIVLEFMDEKSIINIFN